MLHKYVGSFAERLVSLPHHLIQRHPLLLHCTKLLLEVRLLTIVIIFLDFHFSMILTSSSCLSTTLAHYFIFKGFFVIHELNVLRREHRTWSILISILFNLMNFIINIFVKISWNSNSLAFHLCHKLIDSYVFFSTITYSIMIYFLFSLL